MRRTRALIVSTIVLALALSAARARSGPDAVLFRPRLADPRESLMRFRFSSFTQDFRYGTDVADSTSVAGVDEDERGVGFGITAGRTFRAPLWGRVGRWRAPGRCYQLVAPLTVDVSFDRVDADFINVSDYQYGGGIDVLWSGDGDGARGTASFERPAVSSRVALLHRSSHVSDDYLGRARFGRNQQGLVEASTLSQRPPLKRAVLSYEALETVASVEWAPRALPGATLRAYGGGEFKIWLSHLRPRRLRSPAASCGLELRSAGSRADVPPGALARAVNRWLHADAVTTAWIAALDLRLARPFDFASCDNPAGTGEVWTPRLWTDCPHGREGRYAGSWRGMLGLALYDPAARDASRGGRLVGREVLVALDWSGGYSTHGAFLDQRRRDHPRWYIAPSLTAHF